MKIMVNEKVSEHMLRQPWRGKFVDNCIKQGSTPENIFQHFLGGSGNHTIDCAFVWGATPEGDNFWADKCVALKRLYKNNKWEYKTKRIRL